MIPFLVLAFAPFVYAAPAPTPSPTPKAPARVVRRTKAVKPSRPVARKALPSGPYGTPKTGSKPLVIVPRVAAKKPVAQDPTSFQLAKAGAGKLVLGFSSRDPDLQLDPRAPMAVQLIPHPPLTVKPAILTSWPANPGQRVNITYQKAVPNRENAILVAASYKVCSKKTRKCRKTKTQAEFSFRP